MTGTQITLNENDLITVVMKPVGKNGQISIGSEFAGLPIIAYVVADKRDYVVDDKNSKIRKSLK
ncbi:MAG: hypothetical protein KAS66_06805 [Candidatus Omnitrophica bacterium]|nr:hypothetical protein [Candidatus Omnitrophota bacterium]